MTDGLNFVGDYEFFFQLGRNDCVGREFFLEYPSVERSILHLSPFRSSIQLLATIKQTKVPLSRVLKRQINVFESFLDIPTYNN